MIEIEFNIKYNLNIKQKSFFKNNTHYFCIFAGGYGSGKTYALCLKALKYVFLYPNARHIFLCLDYDKAKRVAVPILCEILNNNNIQYFLNKSELILQPGFSSGIGGIYFKSANNPEKLVSYEYQTAFVDEASLMEEDVFYRLLGRIRGRGFHQINLAFTWDRVPHHWTYKKFWEAPIKNMALYRASSALNIKYIGKEYIEILQKNYSNEMIKNYIEGYPVALNQNQIYWAFNIEKHVKSEILYRPELPLGVSYDFNINPMVVVFIQWDKNNSYAIDEIVLKNANTEKMTERVIAKIKEFNINLDTIYIFGDPAGRAGTTKSLENDYQIIERILRKSFNHVYLNVRKDHVDLRGRYTWINRLFSGGEGISINISKKCQNLIQDYLTMSYKEHSDLPDKSDPNRSHSSDAHDYYLYEQFPFAGKNRFIL